MKGNLMVGKRVVVKGLSKRELFMAGNGHVKGL